ncbi:MAG TPA: hypothetical protein HPP77_11315 [Candidatus Hydrogenedentes bacterium]|nr:hypothetical protein [Candidatus Hydrogenedentota bacterium]HIJ74393.1 hypothetical protein [Candidatus Hydrogenedentota bacterium]
MMNWPFDADVPKHEWTKIAASGFAGAVPACVYDGARLDGGVPLGALGTGYFTLEGNGRIGRCSIYNDIVPPRHDATEWLTLRVGNASLPLSTARIAYWGHYPVADLVARFDEKPLDIGIRAFSPFVPGDRAASNTPAALFELEIRNRGTEPLECELAIVPPQPKKDDATGALAGEGLAAYSGKDALRGTVGCQLAPGASSRIRFSFGWYAPCWRDSGSEAHVHRYAQRYDSAQTVAEDALGRFDELLARVLAWQQQVYDSDHPDWLCDWLVQSLYSLAKNTIWIARTRSDEWWGEDGWFTHNESHTGCPITETMVCRMHGHFPALLFFPELEATTLDAFRHFQIEDGEVPFTYGRETSMRDPRYHCQHPLNSGQYAQMVYRLFLRTGDKDRLAYFYPSVKRAIQYQYTLDDDGDGLVNDQAHVRPGECWPANQFYDIWPWWGTSAYVAGTWLATLSIGKAMAKLMADEAFGAEMNDWLERGKKAYQEKLWTGQYYRLWHDPANSRSCDVSLGNQLMAEWCASIAGLPGVLPEEQVKTALGTIKRLNMHATAYGLVNGVTPDGAPYDTGLCLPGDHATHTFVGESLCAAMTYMYRGHQETGLEIARRLYEAIALKSASPWNQRCLLNGKTGLPLWGDDYYSNLVVWAVPMALARQGIQAFTKGEGLVTRMMTIRGPRE